MYLHHNCSVIISVNGYYELVYNVNVHTLTAIPGDCVHMATELQEFCTKVSSDFVHGSGPCPGIFKGGGSNFGLLVYFRATLSNPPPPK